MMHRAPVNETLNHVLRWFNANPRADVYRLAVIEPVDARVFREDLQMRPHGRTIYLPRPCYARDFIRLRDLIEEAYGVERRLPLLPSRELAAASNDEYIPDVAAFAHNVELLKAMHGSVEDAAVADALDSVWPGFDEEEAEL